MVERAEGVTWLPNRCRRTDGFVSVDASNEPGRLITCSLDFTGCRLHLNAACARATRNAGSVRLLLEPPDVVVEIVDVRGEAFATSQHDFGPLAARSSFAAMLDTRPNVVWISTPTPLHAEQAIAALEAGAHSFYKKPMSDNLAGARRMKHGFFSKL